MTCPYLDYRREADGKSFEHERPYCNAANEFVQPMRADICNDRYGLDHSTDCEIYLRHADDEEVRSDGGHKPAIDDDASSTPREVER